VNKKILDKVQKLAYQKEKIYYYCNQSFYCQLFKICSGWRIKMYLGLAVDWLEARKGNAITGIFSSSRLGRDRNSIGGIEHNVKVK
jgi:hypothetical protein